MFSKTNPLYQYSTNSLIFSILYEIFQSTRQNLDRRLAEWSEKIRIRQILCRSERDWIEVSLKFKIFPFESIIAKNGRKSIEWLDDIICQMSMFLVVMKVSSRYFVDNQCFPELRRLNFWYSLLSLHFSISWSFWSRVCEFVMGMFYIRDKCRHAKVFQWLCNFVKRKLNKDIIRYIENPWHYHWRFEFKKSICFDKE